MSGSVANSIKLPLEMGLMRIATAANYEGSNLICEYIGRYGGTLARWSVFEVSRTFKR